MSKSINLNKSINLKNLTTEQIKQINKIIINQNKKKKITAHFKKMEKICPGYRSLLKEYSKLSTPKEFLITTPVKILVTFVWEEGLDYDVVGVDFYRGWENSIKYSKNKPDEVKKISFQYKKKIKTFCDKLEKIVLKNTPAAPRGVKCNVDDIVNNIIAQMAIDIKKETSNEKENR